MQSILPKEIGQEHSVKELPEADAFFVECLAWGLLRAYQVRQPPVPVREMIKHAIPVFERLTLLELNLGLYTATYRSCLDGSRLIAVDLNAPRETQRASMARELFVAFCHSPRAAELPYTCCNHPHFYSGFFARSLLMPTTWIRQVCAEDISVEGLAARFDVPISMIVLRLNEIFIYHAQSRSSRPLAEALFSLEEPWRSRFLELVIDVIDNNKVKSPTKRNLAYWLDNNPALYQELRYMLNAWRRPLNISSTISLTQRPIT